MSCADFWTSTRGETDEQLRELDFAGGFADARVDPVAFPVAGSRAGGTVCGGGSGLPEGFGALRGGGRRACFDDDIAGRHVYLVAPRNESGRADWGARRFDVGGNVHPKRDRAVRLPRPCRRISNRTTDGDVVAGGSLVSGRPFAESKDRGRAASDWKNGSRPCHPVLRVPSAGCSGSAGMVPPGGAAAGEGADRLDRGANRSGYRA